MMLILGLDPGANTGAAIFEDGKLLHLTTIVPYKIGDLLGEHIFSRVIYEDSNLQSHVWTSHPSKAAAMKMARNLGEVDAWCKLILYTCEKHGIAAHGISPKNKGAKLNAEQFEKVTGWTARSNQHERDSAMIAWPYRYAKS